MNSVYGGGWCYLDAYSLARQSNQAYSCRHIKGNWHDPFRPLPPNMGNNSSFTCLVSLYIIGIMEFLKHKAEINFTIIVCYMNIFLG